MKKILLFFALISLLSIYNQIIAQNFMHFIPDGDYFNKDCSQITYDKNNQKLWACTRGDNVLISFNGSNFTYYNTQLGLQDAGSPQNDIEVDHNGIVWINYSYNIQKFDGAIVTEYNTSNSQINSDFHNDMAITNTGEVYIGSSNGFGVSMYNGTTWTTKGNWSISGMNDVFTVLSIDYNDYDSSIWFSGYSNLYRLKNGVLNSWTYTNMGITGYGDILDITFDQYGNTWLAMHNFDNNPNTGGIIKYNGTSWTKYNTSNSGISSNQIIKIDWDGSKLLIVSHLSFETFDGMSNWIKYDNTNSNFPSNISLLRDVVSVDSNNCYIASAYGIILMTNIPAKINDLSGNLSVIIYPNPSTKNQAITIQSTEILHNVNIQSIDGKILFEQQNIQNKTFEISTENWAKGVYIVQQTNAQGQAFSQKLIVE